MYSVCVAAEDCSVWGREAFIPGRESKICGCSGWDATGGAPGAMTLSACAVVCEEAKSSVIIAAVEISADCEGVITLSVCAAAEGEEAESSVIIAEVDILAGSGTGGAGEGSVSIGSLAANSRSCFSRERSALRANSALFFSLRSFSFFCIWDWKSSFARRVSGDSLKTRSMST